MSGFVAMTTTCTLLIDSNFSDAKYGTLSAALLAISATYCIYGVWISIFLYGRKIDHLTRESANNEAYDGVNYGLDNLVEDDGEKSFVSEF